MNARNTINHSAMLMSRLLTSIPLTFFLFLARPVLGSAPLNGRRGVARVVAALLPAARQLKSPHRVRHGDRQRARALPDRPRRREVRYAGRAPGSRNLGNVASPRGCEPRLPA